MYAPVVAIAKKLEEVVVHETRSGVDVSHLERRKDLLVSRSGDILTINLHPGKVKSRGHAHNLRGELKGGYDDVVRLFQRIRDESHRFAVSYHDVLRRNGQTKNVLENIPKVGPKTRSKLLKSFGSLSGVEKATEAEVAAVVGVVLAKNIKQYLGK